MSIKIEIYGEHAREALTELAGLSRGLMGQLPASAPAKSEPAPTPAPSSELAAQAVAEAEPETPPAATPAPEAPATGGLDTRKVHEPPEGKQRRNPAQKASDERLMGLSVKKGVPLEQVNELILKVGRERVEQELTDMEPLTKDNISTGGERVNPEDDAQDEADEAAEADAKRDPQTPLTEDDLKKAMTAYVNKFGMEAVQTDGKAIFEDALGQPPGEAKGWRMSLVAAQGQDVLAKAIAAWDEAAEAEHRYGSASNG